MVIIHGVTATCHKERYQKAMRDKRKTAVRRETRHVIPGICADARRLGVSRMHLWAVLTGRRESEPLMRRYRAFRGE